MEPLGLRIPVNWVRSGSDPALFRTGRGHLGIHLDPSTCNANSGTLGCVGDPPQRRKLADLIERRNVQALVVND